MLKKTQRVMTGAIGTCLAGVAAVVTSLSQPVAASDAGPVRFSSFHETYVSATPADWATSSDHIAVVSATKESKGRSQGETTERIVTLKVDRVLWSNTGAADLPESFDMPAFGWIEGREVVMNATSRLEPGHRYFVGLVKLDSRCSEGDLPDPGGWSVIGSGGIIPMDDGVVGRGEVEGKADQAVTGEKGSMLAIAKSGPRVGDMVKLVAAAERGKRTEQPGVREGC